MLYNPNSLSSRRALAKAIQRKLEAGRFGLHHDPYTDEEIYYKKLPEDSRLMVLVYTSIVQGQVREVGKDALRVALVYEKEGDRGGSAIIGLAKATRVNRTGTVNAIVDRMVERIYQVRNQAKDISRCRSCGAPRFKSKKGNLVCAEACWTRR